MSISIMLLDQNSNANDVDIMVFETSVLFPPPVFWGGGIYDMVPRVDPLTSILAVLARSCQILTTSWQPWIPWQDSY